MSIRTCFWYEKDALEAAEYYVRLIENSEIEHVQKIGPDKVLLVNFNLDGVPYQGLNGGSVYSQTAAASIMVTVDTQEEVDRLWTGLTENGGRAGHCAWLKDRWGVSWQILPRPMFQLIQSSDKWAAGRAIEAMRKMGKIDLAEMQRAYDGS